MNASHAIKVATTIAAIKAAREPLAVDADGLPVGDMGINYAKLPGFLREHPFLTGGAVAGAAPAALGAGIGALTGDSEETDAHGNVTRKGTRGRNALIGAGLLGIPAGLLGGGATSSAVEHIRRTTTPKGQFDEAKEKLMAVLGMKG